MRKCGLFLLLTASLARGLAAPAEIALDVGHGLADTGAVSARGRPEYEFNLDFARVLAETLRSRGWPVREVNFDGGVLRLADRPLLASGSAFFLSVHHDSISTPYLAAWDWDGAEQSYTVHKRGFGLFVSHDNPQPALSLRCASALGRALRAAGFVPTDWHGRKHLPADRENGVWYYDNLVVLYRTTLPAVLFEAGVIKHRDEELALRDPVRQASMAAALAEGFADCLPAPVAVSDAAGTVTEKPAPE